MITSIYYNEYEVFYRPCTVDEDVLDHSFENDIFLSKIPSIRIDHGSIIDIGAHIGTFSLMSSQKFKNSTIYAVEASQSSFRILERNIKTNDIINIKPFNLALSNHNGFEKLFIAPDNWANRIVGNHQGMPFEMVRSMSLDTFFDINQIRTCDLLKSNCEGAEFKILLSASTKTLTKIKLMIVLYHEDFETNYTKLLV